MNKVILMGNLTRDVEVHHLQNGRAMARMGIAVNRRFKNAETGQYEVDFFNLTAWEKTAEFCGRYLKKGSRVIVEGRLQTYSYTGQDGVKRSGVDIQVENIEFAGDKRTDEAPSKDKPADKTPPIEDNEDFVGEEIPDHKMPF